MRALSLMAGAVLAAGLATAAFAQVSVIGDGLVTQCSAMALAGDDSNEALNACTRAIQDELLTPGNMAKTYVNRGVIYLRQGELDRAETDFAAAEVLRPDLAEIYVNRSVVLMRRGQWRDAIDTLDHGLSLNPTEPEKAYFNRAMAREQLDDLSGAFADLSRAAELKPDWALPQRELARYRVEPSSKG